MLVGMYSKGYISMILMISITGAIAFVVFGLMSSSQYLFSVIRSVREVDGARSAALYCGHILLNASLSDALYVPTLGVERISPNRTTCTYDAFSSAQMIEQGVITYEKEVVLKGTSYASGRLYSGVSDIHTNPRYIASTYALKLKFRITDSLSNFIIIKSLEKI